MSDLSYRRLHDLDAAAQWFERPAGQAILDSEQGLIAEALRNTHAGLPWLWIGPANGPTSGRSNAVSYEHPTVGSKAASDANDANTDDEKRLAADLAAANIGRGLRLCISAEGWRGPILCRLPLPIATESLGAVVLQHVTSLRNAGSGALLAECARALVPGGRLHLLALNPISPYRLRWQGRGLRGADAPHLRQLLRDVGLAPEPYAQGIGPQWAMELSELPQAGAGLRAAYVQRADKRTIPMTLIRQRKPRPLTDQVPAALRVRVEQTDTRRRRSAS
ncbi:MAG: hypothetical protein IT473_02170 [Lysobacter sp.]|nr:hypothetical protein [Lysobacter sp.]